MPKKTETPGPFDSTRDGDPCPYCEDWHANHDECPFRVLSPDAPEVPDLLRSVVFTDPAAPAPSGAKRVTPHVTSGLIVNGEKAPAFVVCATEPVHVEAGMGEPTILSMAVLTDDIAFGDDYRVQIGGLDVLCPAGLDDPANAHCWEAVDEMWTRVWLYVEHVEFALGRAEGA